MTCSGSRRLAAAAARLRSGPCPVVCSATAAHRLDAGHLLIWRLLPVWQSRTVRTHRPPSVSISAARTPAPPVAPASRPALLPSPLRRSQCHAEQWTAPESRNLAKTFCEQRAISSPSVTRVGKGRLIKGPRGCPRGEWGPAAGRGTGKGTACGAGRVGGGKLPGTCCESRCEARDRIHPRLNGVAPSDLLTGEKDSTGDNNEHCPSLSDAFHGRLISSECRSVGT